MRQQQIRRRATRRGEPESADPAASSTAPRPGITTDRAVETLAAIDAALLAHTAG